MLSGAPPTKAEVRDAFGIDVGDLRPHEGGFEADAFTDGRWFVKRWRYDSPDERALALTNDLADRGLPVPGAARAVDGRYTAEHDGKQYAVFPFVHGHNATWADQTAIASVMRAVHAIDDVNLPRIEPDLAYGPMLRELVDHPWLAKYRGEVEAHVDRLEAAVERTRTIDVRHVVCHYDMQPHNVLVDDDDRLVAVVDWCWGELAPREHDVFVAFCGPDPVGFLRAYGATGIDLVHLEYMLLERSIRYATGRVEHELDREFVDEVKQVFLMTRSHVDLSDMPAAVSAELGPAIQRVEAALIATGNVGRVHVHRWGDGSSHFHLWLYGRAVGEQQLLGVGLVLWAMSLPPMSQADRDAAMSSIAASLAAGDT